MARMGPLPAGERQEKMRSAALLLLDGVRPSSVARAVGVSAPTVAVWREELRGEGLIFPGDPEKGDRRTAAERRRELYRDFVQLDDDGRAVAGPPSDEEIEWLEVGLGEAWEREYAAREAGTDWWSRNRDRLGYPERRPYKKVGCVYRRTG